MKSIILLLCLVLAFAGIDSSNAQLTSLSGSAGALEGGAGGGGAPAGPPATVGTIDAWSAITAYLVGDLALYQNKIFKRLIAGTTATAPSADGTNWAQISGDGLPVWNGSKAYLLDDLVRYNSIIYVRLIAGTTATSPDADGVNWVALGTDYTPEQSNLYFTNARAIAAPITGFVSGAGAVAATDSVLQAVNKLDGNTALKENTITANTSADYYRGDKTFQTLNTLAVPELTNLYFTDPRVIAAPITGFVSGAGVVAATDSVLQAVNKLDGNVAGKVSNVLPSANIIVGNGSNIAAAVAMSGESTIDNAGAVTLSNAAVIGKQHSAIGAATYKSLQEVHNVLASTGKITGGSLSDGGAGTLDVSAGTGFIRTADSAASTLYSFDWASASGLALTDLALNHIYIEYNAGAPQIVVDLVERTDFRTNILLGTVSREGTTLFISNFTEVKVSNHANLATQRLLSTAPFARASGGVIGETGTRNLTVTAGVFWEGMTQFSTPMVDTSGADVFEAYYRNGVGGFTKLSAQTQYNNTQFDDGTGALATLANNRYAVHWVYLTQAGKVLTVFGRGDYVLLDAQNAKQPVNIPARIKNHARIIGKIIVQKSAATATAILSAFDTQFELAQVIDHGSLINLTNDDHPQYVLANGTRAMTLLDVDNLRLDLNTISSTSGDIILSPTGSINIPALTASRPLLLDASNNIVSSATTNTELSYVSGVTSAIQTQIDNKMPLTDAATFRVGPGRPYATIQSALTAIGDATSTADAISPKRVVVAGGVYDEDLTIPRGRILTIQAEGTVILGNGAGANWSSTNTRNITAVYDGADIFASTAKPALNIMTIPHSDATSTFIAQAGVFNISGGITISGGLTRTLNLSSVIVNGILDGNTGAGLTNIQAYRTLFVGAVNMGAAAILERCYDCQFNALATVNSFNALINSEVRAGMTVSANINAVPPSGFFFTTFTGTFTGPANSLKLDSASDYFFRTNGASLGGAATKVLLSGVASATEGGVITAGTQSIAGAKTFIDTFNISNLTASRAMATDASKNLVSSTTTSTELGYVSGVTSAIQTQLNAKEGGVSATTSADYYRGDKTFQTLNTLAVPELTNLYFTDARAIAAPLTGYSSGAGTVAGTDSILQAIQKLNGNDALYLPLTGGTISSDLTVQGHITLDKVFKMTPITTANRDINYPTPAKGWVIFNDTLSQPQYYNGTQWISF